jgi:hypothetical protein
MKNLKMNFSDLNFDQLEILKESNRIEKRNENRLYSFLAFLAIDLIIGLLIYAGKINFHSMGSIDPMHILSFASLIPAIPLKKKGKKEEKSDDANLSKIKESKKEKKDISRSSLYNGIESLSMRDQKKERSKIRRRLDAFCNAILGKDRSKEEKEKSIKEFNAFYKKNWKLNDYKIDNFSNRSDEDLRKEYQLILDLAKKSLG